MRQGISLLAGLLFVFLQMSSVSSGSNGQENQKTNPRAATTTGGYVGSKVCAPCHQQIYASYSRTDMGRSMSTVTAAILKQLPNSASVFDAQLNRHFSISVHNGQLFQSEWETGEDGKDIFRKTERIDWIMGAGANALGGVVQHGTQLVEAPLTYYAKTRSWALSPGYEEVDRGFNRPIEAECIFCHSGRPNPVGGTIGRFGSPPFEELAIGCENCHGPGAAHVHEMRRSASRAGVSNPSIVNPAKLAPWLADNICMSCHQNGDARVLQPGKKVQDFRPGQPLDHTLAILMVPPTRESPPDSDHVQHYFSMTLSKCYRNTGKKLSCITCHNPHVQPSSQEAPTYFRARCLTCHTEGSCTEPIASRRQTKPADDCLSCHMPKRDVAIISHASLTNHRIVTTSDEPFPDITFQLATPQMPDLVHVNAIPGQGDSVPPPQTLLQAYGQLGVQHREYLQRYFQLAEELEASQPNDINVLEALAARSLQQRTPEGEQAAMGYLQRAIEQGSTSAWDFEQLGGRLLREQKVSEAVACLQQGIERAPYDAKLYALLANAYVSLNRPSDASATLKQALEIFPQMDLLRELLKEVDQSGPPQQGTTDSPQP
jgi:hypothetical protein